MTESNRMVNSMSTPASPLQTAVLLIVFNRPDCTRQIMERLNVVRPARLYIAADGPRSKAEAALCRDVRRLATFAPWDCEVITMLRDTNVGCKLAVSGAISWFFEQEDKGIILEDDCIPTDSFFYLCDQLLERYQNDERVGSVVGSSFLNPLSIGESYYFSRNPLTWGWATWARTWRKYDIEMKAWPRLRNTNFLRLIGMNSVGFSTYWTDVFDRCYNGDVNTWDYQWVLSFWLNNYLACAPRANLVRNIGFSGDGTHHHTYNEIHHGRAANELAFPLIHPQDVVPRPGLDRQFDRADAVFRRALNLFVHRHVPFGKSAWALLRDASRYIGVK